jgi:hypothetical protein
MAPPRLAWGLQERGRGGRRVTACLGLGGSSRSDSRRCRGRSACVPYPRAYRCGVRALVTHEGVGGGTASVAGAIEVAATLSHPPSIPALDRLCIGSELSYHTRLNHYVWACSARVKCDWMGCAYRFQHTCETRPCGALLKQQVKGPSCDLPAAEPSKHEPGVWGGGGQAAAAQGPRTWPVRR